MKNQFSYFNNLKLWLQQDGRYPAVLFIIYLICIFIVNPIGDFPLNDDWSYGINAKALTIENKIFFHDWGAMTLIAHTFWGAIFCKIFGFSFTVLRVSTLVLGWGALMACYHFFQEGGMSKKHAFGGTLLLYFNTFFFVNTFTYMTEVPFLCFFLWAAYFSLKSINGKGTYNIIFATFFSIIAILIRQHAILVPLAFFFTYIIKNKLSLKTVIQSVTPLILTYGSMHIFVKWREAKFGLSKNFGKSKQLIENITNGELQQTLEFDIHIFFELWGLFLIPLLLIILIYFWKKTPLFVKIITTFLALIMSYPYSKIYHWGLLGNTFENLQIGPVSLKTFDKTTPPTMSQPDWENFLLIIFIVGVFLLLWILVQTFNILSFLKNKKSEFVNWSSVFAFTAAFGYFLFLILNSFQFDRYTLISFPFLILFLTPSKMDLKIPIVIRFFSILSFGIISIYNILATHDYLEWNRATWKGIDYGINEHQIPPAQLSANFEFRKQNDVKAWIHIGAEGLDYWNNTPQKYAIAFSPICKFNTIKTFPYTRYMPPRTDSIYLLKKEYLENYDTITCNFDTITSDGKHFVTNQEDIILQTNNAVVTNKTHSGKYAVMVNNTQEYGATFTLKNVFPCEKISISTWRYPADADNKMVVAAESGWLQNADRIATKENNGWEKLIQDINIPHDFKGDELSIYFYNPSENKVWFDDLTIIRMK